jgi:hypothetical protein
MVKIGLIIVCCLWQGVVFVLLGAGIITDIHAVIGLPNDLAFSWTVLINALCFGLLQLPLAWWLLHRR